MLVYSSGILRTIGYMDSYFQGDIDSNKISYEENLAYSFTKTFLKIVFRKHVNCMGLKRV